MTFDNFLDWCEDRCRDECWNIQEALDYYLEDYLDEGYSVFPLYSVGARYYIQMPCHINVAL